MTLLPSFELGMSTETEHSGSSGWSRKHAGYCRSFRREAHSVPYRSWNFE